MAAISLLHPGSAAISLGSSLAPHDVIRLVFNTLVSRNLTKAQRAHPPASPITRGLLTAPGYDQIDMTNK